MFCTKCGAKNEDGALFCMQCGNKLTVAETEPKELVEEPTEEVVAPRRRESNTKRRGAYAKPKRSKAPLVIAIAVVAVVAVVVIIMASNTGSSATSTDPAALDIETTEAVDFEEISTEIQEAFCEATGMEPYFTVYIFDDSCDIYVFKDEESCGRGDDTIAYYRIESDGSILDYVDNVGNSISLDNFTVRDEILAAFSESGGNLNTENDDVGMENPEDEIMVFTEFVDWVNYLTELCENSNLREATDEEIENVASVIQSAYEEEDLELTFNLYIIGACKSQENKSG